jgi:translation initiation factor 5A
MSTTRTIIKSLKPGKMCVIDGEPCKVLDITCSKPGKHGGAKARIEVMGIFDGRRRSVVKPASTEIDVPIVDKKSGQVVAIMDENAQIMDLETYETFDAKIPEELKGKVTQGCEISYWVIMEKRLLVQVR